MLVKETITQSWQALLRNRMRSVLTMSGIIWGLVSVVLLLGYGQGLGGSIVSAFMGMGNNVIVLWPGQTSMQAGGQRAGQRVTFDYDDVQAIREQVPLVKAVSAESSDDFGYKLGNRVVSLTTRGVEMPYGGMRRIDVDEGRYFEEGDFSEHRRVVILGYNAAKRVFQGAPAVGEFVSIGGLQFQVIGVIRNKIQDSMYTGPDNEQGFIPWPAYGDLRSTQHPEIIVFQPLAPDVHTQATAAVREVLARRHHFNPKDEKATPEWDTVETGAMIRTFTVALTAMLGLIGALTLGVGGVGLMNIMLVSVTERTREIGLRKALGARPRHLLAQFLTEALVITFIGGLIGMVLAVIIAHLVPPMPLYSQFYETANHEGDIFLRISPVVMMVSFLILALVGVTSGFWPALKAARLDPIEALRYE